MYYCTSDPVGEKLGSGGGTAWLLQSCHRAWAPGESFAQWLAADKRILMHAGGQSRRLPAYAPSGKILTPVPVFRWERGQRLGQNLLALQMPLYERIMHKAPERLHTLIASGDVYVRARRLQAVPDADVVCYGLWVDPALARNHGVFVSSRQTPDRLDFMLQKPTVERLSSLMQSHLFLMDVGIWLLSDRAVELLMKRSVKDGRLCYYDLYSDFGRALGDHPEVDDEELRSLSVTILPLYEGEFYHYGTSREIISSTAAVQNLVNDQRAIMHHKVKPHPAMFVQNSEMKFILTAENEYTWIENSYLSDGWHLAHHHIITGVPRNDWHVDLPEGTCVDVVPVGETGYALRPYGFEDAFRGALADESTMFLGQPVTQWLADRGVEVETVEGAGDMQSARIFPMTSDLGQLECMLRWMVSDPRSEAGRSLWEQCPKVSADEISATANLRRLYAQRQAFRSVNWTEIAARADRSVFLQVNLADAAHEFVENALPLPPVRHEHLSLLARIHDNMFRSQVRKLQGMPDAAEYESQAFGLLREGLTTYALEKKQRPRLGVLADQIVWSRSPVRVDIAGGWTDTPPYCLMKGGSVINLAVELNGQPPLQVYMKRCEEPVVILRSIDLGATERVETFEQLRNYTAVGSPFSIPKAALALAGFLPEFAAEPAQTLRQALRQFGCGMELTLFSAVPAGSGLGTSSILAATVLGAVSQFCSLGWDKHEICDRTLVLEQLLTTGGGWQDQYGGVLHGIKWLQTQAGFGQTPDVRWMPHSLFTDAEYAPCHLLYYTGITRTAKQILAEIVRGMFLNSTSHLTLLDEMKEHAAEVYEAVIHNRFEQMGALIRKTWTQNQLLDAGTNPAEVQAICRLVDDYCLGYKLPGAGGGGFLYMVAKDAEAAARIKDVLQNNKPNERARFVDMSLSANGLKVSCS